MKNQNILSILIITGVAFTLFCNFSYSFAGEGYYYHINPAYTHLAVQRSFISSKPARKASVAIQCYSYDDLKNALSVQLKKHTQSFQIHMEYDFQFSEVGNILEQAQNEVFSDDDYLANSYVSYSFSYSGYNRNVDIFFQFNFLTTYEEEQAITQKVQEILYGENGIINLEMNAEEKEKEIHDWIVLNVEYDTNLVEYSAYAALFRGKTVCQGYSLLMYRMLDVVDIESRIVVSDSMNHTWNMVYLCGNWYHLDVTWDDPVPDIIGRVLYNYYNLSDSEINDDHILPVGYPTASLGYIEGVCGSDLPSLNIYYRDSDNDGYGDPDSPYEASSQPSGYVTDNTDCNDYDYSIHPGAKEIRGDGIDQDCDGNDLPAIQDTIIVLTNTSPDAIIETGNDAVIYGTAGANHITIESGAHAELLNFIGNNTMTIQSNSSLFTVSRSGATVTLEGSDGTVLKIPATASVQTIAFTDQTLTLSIYDGQVLLDDQVIGSVSDPIQ